jgi:hypothetical protein
MDIFEEICKLKREGKRAALATIINARGSTPSVVAAKMLVREDGSILGTVGGGCVEFDVRKRAIAVIQDEKPKTFTFDLDQRPDDDTGLLCGGSVQVFIEPVIPAPVLYIFGAGHVGLNVSKVAALAGFEVIICDDREEYANHERFPDAREIHAGEMDAVLPELTLQCRLLYCYRHARPPSRFARSSLGPGYARALHRHDRLGAQGSDYLSAVGSGRRSAGELAARLRSDRPGDQRGNAGGDRHLHRG